MNSPFHVSPERLGIGDPVPRAEDPHLLRGEGSYTDDVSLPGQLYGAFVQSSHAHGVIRAIDTAAARKLPGVHAIYTATDLSEYGRIETSVALTGLHGYRICHPGRPALAADKVRFVGEPVACVVAATVAQARDAAEAVVVDIEPLPVVTDAREAAEPAAPQLFDDAPGNVALDYRYGDAAKVAEAFASAAHVTRLKLVNNRIVVAAMEPRSALAAYDVENDRYVLQVPCQGVVAMRAQVAEVMRVPPERVRILTGNVGGSFGMKLGVFPEYVCLLHAARMLGRSVKWTDRRSDSFNSDTHGRDGEVEAALALDSQGRFLALHISGYSNMGAHVTPYGLLPATVTVAKNSASVYRTPLIEVNLKAILTNTVPVGAYRGAGRPEANYYFERLIDAAAAEMGIDRIALRRLNHIRPDEIPFTTPIETTYDSGDFPAVLDRAIALADWKGFPARAKASRKRGMLRGRGLGQYLETTMAPATELAGIRFDPDDTVTIVTGTLDIGQGHLTPFGQVLAQKLGVPLHRVRLFQGDSDVVTVGDVSGGSKSMMSSGVAIAEASAKVIDKGKRIASHFLEAGMHDIVFADGRFSIVGTDRRIEIMEMASRLRNATNLPPDCPTTLDVTHTHGGLPMTFPNGCHVAEVEIDPETGVVAVVKYAIVSDVGTVINPLTVQGQLHGAVMQAVGQALMEQVVYDADGQHLTGSFMDYALPRAANAPRFEYLSSPTPAMTNLLGIKGAGEAGCAGALPAVMNAVVDALSVFGIWHVDMPATPQNVWKAIRAVQLGG
jgi:carbon-monoxide dehydrogenase large subunit